MSERSGRFGLPYILPGQAQKEAFHNEALAMLDGLVAPAVEGPPLAAPPVTPADGQCWIVAAGANGAWAGEADRLALWTAGGWRFLMPAPGMSVWDRTGGHWRCFDGSAWQDGFPAAAVRIGGDQIVGPRLPAILSPSGGTTIDAEARTAVEAIIVTLMTHGLID